MQVLVRDNNVDQALKALKKKMQREGIFREMKLRGHYEKPSEKKAREKAEAVRRARKLARKRVQREGLIPMKPKPVVRRARRPGWRPRRSGGGPRRRAVAAVAASAAAVSVVAAASAAESRCFRRSTARAGANPARAIVFSGVLGYIVERSPHSLGEQRSWQDRRRRACAAWIEA